jgi:hypothetical protein
MLPEDVIAMLETLERGSQRDRAILLVGFAGGLKQATRGHLRISQGAIARRRH